MKLIKDAARATTKSRKTLPPAETTHRLQTQRFTFYPRRSKTNDKTKRKNPKATSNKNARADFYKKLNAPAVAHAKAQELLKPRPQQTRPPPLPTWDWAVKAVSLLRQLQQSQRHRPLVYGVQQ